MFLFALSLVASAKPTHAEIESAAWKQVASRDPDQGAVLVHTAVVAGMECYRGTGTTPASVAKLIEVATDIPSAVRWSTAGLTKSELLAKRGHTLEYWQYLDVPGWTMSADRFWFVRSETSITPDLAYEKWDALLGGGPHSAKFAEIKAAYPDAVEPLVNIGEWLFKSAGQGQTAVDYLVCTDPGGSIPAAIQSAATRRTLPDTVADIMREARRREGS